LQWISYHKDCFVKKLTKVSTKKQGLKKLGKKHNKNMCTFSMVELAKMLFHLGEHGSNLGEGDTFSSLLILNCSFERF
jgi:hypothetical protein